MVNDINWRTKAWWRTKRAIRSAYRAIAWRLVEYSKPDMIAIAQMWRARGAWIGSNVHIDPTCYLDESYASLLEIQEDVVIAMGTAFILHDSSVNNVTVGPLKLGRVVIEAGAYIGAFVIVLPGVVIGKGSIVGAGSLVNSTIPPGVVVLGRPAKVVCSVQDLAQRFIERSAISSDMVFYQTFPSQKEKKMVSPEELKSVALQSIQEASDWVTSLRKMQKGNN